MDQTAISLYELNNLVRGVLTTSFDQLFWIQAETSDVRCNQNGHCYLEFIEKDASNRNIIAKARGSIWSNVFRLLKAYFESETGQTFASGLKVLIQVSIEFHEVYGYSLNVHNIDPTYTLGDQVKNRALILKQLEEEGVLTLNKELQLAKPANRIAIISSPTAAGYEDFCNQLEGNKEGFIFYTKLFPAIMQGERTEGAIIAALDRIYENTGKFDAVVIIRGGGATSDLSSFDSYLLAANCAQFPLPIITGIGHERDDTVLDIVAHTRAKTPTAVAEFLLRNISETADELNNIQDSIIFETNKRLTEETAVLTTLSAKYSYITKDKTKDQLNKLHLITERLKNAVNKLIQEQKHNLISKEQHIELISPENILKKGYTLTLAGNKIIKSVSQIKKGEIITNRFSDGEIESVVK
ncbi:exodeoxyribonuclease VII large subunit [Dysgonomonas macrotermitis]|uniref:Exodeoxyribonuclease 7 large subunit n=1 Tax=Dysgonomonas macrotermitis TaxID=1346286 RepID=A0A1M5IFT5_9BACT|nr:exodeoxyribonuclease VII large subunit [Dysgonomonas macrotermitis]SHG27095.1 Exodeoxyribonuclease VII large subunit [Dysgonomonas macrotermitis]